MDLSYGHEYDTFREEVKSFIQAHQHKQPGPGDGLKSPALREWQRLLIETATTVERFPASTVVLAQSLTLLSLVLLPRNLAPHGCTVALMGKA